MIRKLTLALLAVAILALPAFASVQNVKVSGFVDSTFLVRDQFDLGSSASDGTTRYQNLLITYAGLRVDADLTDNVSATIALLNERPWDETGTSNNADIDLNLAYVTLREMLYSPLTVVIGRQILHYGNGFIVGASGPNNIVASDSALAGVAADLTRRTAHDAVKMVFDYNPLTIDVFASKEDANTLAGTGALNDDVNLYGINANYKLGDKWDTVVEGYFFSKIDESFKSGTTVNGAKADTVYVPGLRASTNPIKGLNVQGEVAWQRGNKASTGSLPPPASTTARADNQQREAMGAQAIVNYLLPFQKTEKYKPVVTGVYSWVSGDHNPADATHRGTTPASTEKYTAWDPMFEDQGGGKIYNAIFDLTNVHIAMGALQFNPMEDLTSKFTWTSLWIDNDFTKTGACSGATCFNLRQPDLQGTYLTPSVTSNRHIGNEFDADFIYAYTEDVEFGFSAGWFFPGEYFNDDTANVTETAKQFIATVGVDF